MDRLDVLIIGAGISGIGAACHLARNCPGKSVAILERRSEIGGTWDLFKYPGIRSDSDMFTFGYNFRPWTNPKTLADGPSIKKYVIDTAHKYGVDKKIHFGRQVSEASWNSPDQCWTLRAVNEKTGREEFWSAKFIMICTGYYNYDKGYKPDFPGEKDFQGTVIHPQFWPENLNYSGKRVVVIGSGATAVTLLPAMAEKTSHITMLQRSPTYMVSVPEIDPMAAGLMKSLPDMVAYRLMRLRNIALQRWGFVASRAFPAQARKLILGLARRQLGKDFDMSHFTPSYDPWDERICAMPGGDLFKVLKSGKAKVVTGNIEKFTSNGILLKSGETLPADIIITATGLELQFLGGMKVMVDGELKGPQESMLYKSVLLEGIPNASIVIGYTNASWTLRADLAAEYVCRLLRHMDSKGYSVVTPVDRDGCRTSETVMGSLKSGYVIRAADRMPVQGSHGPWRLTHDYYRDIPMLKKDPVEDRYLRFEKRLKAVSERNAVRDTEDSSSRSGRTAAR